MNKNHAKLWQYCEAHKPPADEHAWMSPSSFHRTLRCPASVSRDHALRRREMWMRDQATLTGNENIRLLLDNTPEEGPDPAQDGTACHKVFEECTMALEVPTNYFVKTKLRSYGASPELLDDDFVIENLIKSIENVIRTLTLDGEPAWQENEIRLPLVGCASFGTADLVFEKGDTLYVWDLKTGRQEVSPEENEQLMAYASAVLDAIGYDAYRAVSLGIVGIRFPSSTWETTPEIIEEWRDDTMRPRVKDAHSLNPSAFPGEHCLYCPAKLWCPEWNTVVNFRQNEWYFFGKPMGELDDVELVDRYMMAKQVERFQNDAKREIALRYEGFGRMEGERRVQYVRPAPIVDYVDETVAVKALEETLSPVEQEEFVQKRAVNPGRLKAYVSEEMYNRLTRVKTRKPYVKMTGV